MVKEGLINGIIFALVLIVTAVGAFYHTPEPPVEYTTVRGQRAVFQGSGLYRYDPVSLVREGVIWDVINLFIGLPLFAVAIFLALKKTLQGRLLMGGLLFYFFYVYLMYAMMMSFNILFLAYVAIFALSAVSFFRNMRYIDVPLLPEQVSEGFPRTLFIVFSVALSAALLLLWLGRIVPVMTSGRFPEELAGLTTFETQALDLGFVVPLSLSAGLLLWRRSPWGYFLAAVAITFGLMMFITIPAWIIIPLLQDAKINVLEAVPFLALCLIGLVIFILFYGNVHGTRKSWDRSD